MSLQRTLSINATSEGIISIRFIPSEFRHVLPSFTKLWTPFHEEEEEEEAGKPYFVNAQDTILIRENKQGIMQRVFYPPWIRIRKSPSPPPPPPSPAVEEDRKTLPLESEDEDDRLPEYVEEEDDYETTKCPISLLVRESHIPMELHFDSHCLICYKPLSEDSTFARCTSSNFCEHTFHLSCIQAWYQREHKCPVCKRVFHAIMIPPSTTTV